MKKQIFMLFVGFFTFNVGIFAQEFDSVKGFDSVRSLVEARIPVGFEIIHIADSSPEADALVRRYSRNEYPDDLLVTHILAQSENPISQARYRLLRLSAIAALGNHLRSFFEGELLEKLIQMGNSEVEARQFIGILISQAKVSSVRTLHENFYKSWNPKTGDACYGYFAYLGISIPGPEEIAEAVRTQARKSGTNDPATVTSGKTDFDLIFSLKEAADIFLGEDNGLKEFRENVRRLRN